MSMNLDGFFDELANMFDSRPKPEKIQVYKQKLRRFSSEQLVEILNSVVEECKSYPKLSEIFKAATALGYTSADLVRTISHRWEKTDCPLCEGEGRLAVFWEYYGEVRGDTRVEVNRLSKILPYSNSLQRGYEPNKEFRSIWRCRCGAGDVPTVPKAWPKWSSAVEPVRTVYK